MTTTKTQREELVESREKEVLALIEKRKNMDREEKAQVKVSKKIKKGNQREQKNKKT